MNTLPNKEPSGEGEYSITSQNTWTDDSQIDVLSTKTNDSQSCCDSLETQAESECVIIDDVDKNGSGPSSAVYGEGIPHLKRRKLHMDTMACFQHADTEDGKKPLANPSVQPLSLRRNLHPLSRKRKSRSNGEVKIEEELCDPTENPVNPYGHGFAPGSQGFVSAADMYKIASNTKVETPSDKSPYGKGKGKLSMAKRKNPHQSSILSFMQGGKNNSKTSASSTPVKNEIAKRNDSDAEGMSNSQGSSLPGTRCTMHSPIKSVGNSKVLYTCSPSGSPRSSQGVTSALSSSQEKTFLHHHPSSNNKLTSSCTESSSQSEFSSKKSPTTRTCMYSPLKSVGNSNVIYISDSDSSQGPSQVSCASLTSNIADNAVVKQLFSAQKNLNLTKEKGKKKANSKKLHKTLQKSKIAHAVDKKELVHIKTEAGKYLENDSFDFNKAFGSDTEFTLSDCEGTVKKESSKIVTDKYGLLGTGNYPKANPADNQTGVNYFEMLPPEVMEQIFCGLPMLDLCLNSNRVCTQWNDIIANEKFLPWKKLYHKLKKDLGTSRQDVQAIMNKNGMTSASTFLIGLIRYMKDFKPVTAGNMLQCLQKHSRYKWARDLLQERLQDCLVNEEPIPWCVITVLVIVSGEVYTIQEVIRCLTVSSSQCTATEIIECLYCVATFLYAFKLARRADVWNGMHYRLFYALYLYENASSSSVADLQGLMAQSRGQQSLVKYSSSSESVRLTHEQLRIVKHQPTACEVIKIVAFAGTGKTTTLVRYTQLRPDKKFLLVVYNKSVRDYALTKFPSNVTCKTGHALAYQIFGRRYHSKLFGIKVYSLTQTLTARKGENLFIQAKNVLSTLEAYFASADREISMRHVPSTRIDDNSGRLIPIDPKAKMLYVQDAVYIWRRMQDLNDRKVGMTHDGYLKLYQLSRPSLRQYDCLLIDEAQDLTPAITDILLQQPQGKILVGDPHQQIYSFRGAINAMDTIRADTIFYLTQSFRFGPEIAQVAAHCLEILKQEKKKTLVGSGKKCTVMGDKVGQLAVISRCNFTVFSEAVKKCCYSDEQCKIAFVGGTENFGFPMMMDMYALTLSREEREKEGIEIEHKLIKMFKSFPELEGFATKSLDKELLGKIKIVKTFHHNLPLLVRKIESKCVRDERQADYVFSTAHKAKGLEFSTVRVTDDFLAEFQPSTSVNFDLDLDGEPILQINVPVPTIRLGDKDTDEGNLLYVAVTRAKNALQMSPTLLRILNQAGEKFEFPVYSEDLRLAGKTFKCKETDQEFKPMALTLEHKSLKLGDGSVKPDYIYSPAFLSEDFGSFAGLLGLKENMDEKEKKKPSIPANAFYVGE